MGRALRKRGRSQSSAVVTSVPDVDDWEKVEVDGGNDDDPTPSTTLVKKVPKEKDVNVKSSTFHMTINTNQRYPTPEALERDLRLFGSALMQQMVHQGCSRIGCLCLR